MSYHWKWKVDTLPLRCPLSPASPTSLHPGIVACICVISKHVKKIHQCITFAFNHFTCFKEAETMRTSVPFSPRYLACLCLPFTKVAAAGAGLAWRHSTERTESKQTKIGFFSFLFFLYLFLLFFWTGKGFSCTCLWWQVPGFMLIWGPWSKL